MKNRKFVIIAGLPYNPTYKICTEHTKRCRHLDPDNERKQHCQDHQYCFEPFRNFDIETKEYLSELIMRLNDLEREKNLQHWILLLRELRWNYDKYGSKFNKYEKIIIQNILRKSGN